MNTVYQVGRDDGPHQMLPRGEEAFGASKDSNTEALEIFVGGT